MPGLLGKKIGMTSVFSAEGKNLPCTVIEVGPCVVTQIKTLEKDGYEAVQLGFQEKKEKHTTQPEMGHFKKAGVAPQRHLAEFKNFETEYKLGDVITVDFLEDGFRTGNLLSSRKRIGHERNIIREIGMYPFVFGIRGLFLFLAVISYGATRAHPRYSNRTVAIHKPFTLISKDNLKELIDHLAMLKINRLHFTQEVHDTTPEGQQKMKDMNLYAKSNKITISNGTTHTHDIISYLPFQAELLIWKANISDCDEDKKGYSNI